jgi:hypothetical protein
MPASSEPVVSAPEAAAVVETPAPAEAAAPATEIPAAAEAAPAIEPAGEADKPTV